MSAINDEKLVDPSFRGSGHNTFTDSETFIETLTA